MNQSLNYMDNSTDLPGSSYRRLTFLSKPALEGNESHDEEPRQGGDHYPDKEMLVPDCFLQPPAEHSRQHHPQCHETGTDRVMRRLMLATRDIDHIEHISGETEAVAKLFKADAYVDQSEILGLRVREVDKHRIGQMHDADHRPEYRFKTPARSQHTAQQT